MDNTTIYEFLQEKSVTPTGPGSYSDSIEMSNALKVFKKNSSSKTKGKKDVNFYDYDGSLVDSYSTEEFLQLSAMPVNPSHDGLTAQGWNWTLSDAKEYASDYGKLNIGQMYITNDGKTRIHIKLEEGRLKPRLGLGINGSVVVDWGDNSQTDTMTGSSLSTAVYQQHEYSAPGEYTISIAVTGEIAFLGALNYIPSLDLLSGPELLTKTNGNIHTNKVYLSSIKSIELGSNVAVIRQNAFNSCYSLTSITIPNSITSIGTNAFYNCYSLTSITIPNSITNISDSTFGRCYSLTSITIPNSVTIIGKSAFEYCDSLTSITMPDNVTSIDINAFNSCYSLTNVIIPDNVTSIGTNAFYNCYGLGFIKFESSTPATVANANVWSDIPTDCIIYVPQGSLSAYTSASNYPNSSTYTYVEY